MRLWVSDKKKKTNICNNFTLLRELHYTEQLFANADVIFFKECDTIHHSLQKKMMHILSNLFMKKTRFFFLFFCPFVLNENLFTVISCGLKSDAAKRTKWTFFVTIYWYIRKLKKMVGSHKNSIGYCIR